MSQIASISNTLWLSSSNIHQWAISRNQSLNFTDHSHGKMFAVAMIRDSLGNRKTVAAQIAKFMGPTWCPPGSCRPQMYPMLAPWTLLSGRAMIWEHVPHFWSLFERSRPLYSTHNEPMILSSTIILWITLISRFMGPTWGPSGADRTQVGPILAPWTLLSG